MWKVKEAGVTGASSQAKALTHPWPSFSFQHPSRPPFFHPAHMATWTCRKQGSQVRTRC